MKLFDKKDVRVGLEFMGIDKEPWDVGHYRQRIPLHVILDFAGVQDERLQFIESMKLGWEV